MFAECGRSNLSSCRRPNKVRSAVRVCRGDSVESILTDRSITNILLAAVNIGRQSLFNAFGDKRKLYLEALERYQRESSASHLERLNSSASPLSGIEALWLGWS